MRVIVRMWAIAGGGGAAPGGRREDERASANRRGRARRAARRPAPAVGVDQRLGQRHQQQRAEPVARRDQAHCHRPPPHEPAAGGGVHRRDDEPTARRRRRARTWRSPTNDAVDPRREDQAAGDQDAADHHESTGADAVGQRTRHDAEPEEQQQRDAEHQGGGTAPGAEVVGHGVEERPERVRGAEAGARCQGRAERHRPRPAGVELIRRRSARPIAAAAHPSSEAQNASSTAAPASGAWYGQKWPAPSIVAKPAPSCSADSRGQGGVAERVVGGVEHQAGSAWWATTAPSRRGGSAAPTGTGRGCTRPSSRRPPRPSQRVVGRDADRLVAARRARPAAARPGASKNASPSPGVCQILAKSCHT